MDEKELVGGKNWCGLRVEGTAGTNPRGMMKLRGMWGSRVTRKKAEQIMGALGIKH